MSGTEKGPNGGPQNEEVENVMNNVRNGGSVVTQVSTAIAGLILAGYGLVFIVNAVLGH